MGKDDRVRADSLSNERPKTWILAETTEPGELNSVYPVDSGLACFADQTAAKALGETLERLAKFEPDKTLHETLGFEFHDISLNYRLAPAASLNVIMFESGLGSDPMYSSFWGLDQDGRVLSLVTEFGLFDQSGSIFRAQ